ncbi:MAG: DNRLRE domain-containing protein [Planctomycetaceae bacterium]
MHRTAFTFAALASLACSSAAIAAPDDWAEGSAGPFRGHATYDGANSTDYNRAGQLRWRNRGVGDWRDADGKPQGNKPYAVAAIAAGVGTAPVEWDVTALVRDWATGKLRNKGVLLRNVQGGGTVDFRSREVRDEAVRPKLIVVIGSRQRTFEAVADTHLEPSTYRPQGNGEKLAVAGDQPVLIRFDLSDLQPNQRIARASLRLVTYRQSGGGGEVGVFRCDHGEEFEDAPPKQGLAAKYPNDEGIEKDADVIFATGFESPEWVKEWSHVDARLKNDTVDSHPETKFEPLSGKANRIRLAKGGLTAMNTIYKFKDEIGEEPEEIFFRYHLRFGDDWVQTVQGGKMPGISGTYGRAGWGGRKVNGKDGWSARGSFNTTIPAGNPLEKTQPLGFYCYHADMPTTYGDIWIWNQGYRGFLENNRWYCIEQHVKLNSLGGTGEKGNNDGELRTWIDGRLAFEKTDLRFRDVDRLKIEQVWMNIYHGGTVPSPIECHAYIDNVVIAKKYIGPLATTAAE